MRTFDELQNAFRIYYMEHNTCRNAGAWWSALHLALVMPDVCATLETPLDGVGARYVRWCGEHFPPDPRLTPADRYQMRNAVLHQGGSVPQNKGTNYHSQYKSFSFVRPEDEPVDGDRHFAQDLANQNITLYIRRLVDSTFDHALKSWMNAVASNRGKNAAVEANLRTLVRLQGKELPIATGVRGAPYIVVSST